MVTLSQQLKLLADGFRKRYGKAETLTLADMTKLVTPPPFASGTVIYNKSFSPQIDVPVTLDLLAIPPVMDVPMKLNLYCDALWWLGGEITFNPSSGNPIKIPIGHFTSANDGLTDSVRGVTIPANTKITENKAIIEEHYNGGLSALGRILKMTITFNLGGVINRLLSAFTSLIGGEAA